MFLCNPADSPEWSRPLVDRHSTATTACGLGFDPRTNEYKVVSVLHHIKLLNLYDYDNDSDSLVYHIGVYNLSSDSWREVSEYTVQQMRWAGIGLLFNWRLYWRLWDGGILWFDIASEVTGLIPLPPLNDVPGMTRMTTDVVVLEDCLSLALVAVPLRDNGADPFLISIWKRIKESWMKRFSISISIPIPISPDKLFPVNCWKDDVLLVYVMGEDDLISISLVKEDGDRVTRQKLEDDGTHGAIIMSKESLVSLR